MDFLFLGEKIVETDYGGYLLQYRIHEIKEEKGDIYGISIFQYYNTYEKKELFDYAMIHGFSESITETEKFMELLIQENVFPVHLYSIADDWISKMAS